MYRPASVLYAWILASAFLLGCGGASALAQEPSKVRSNTGTFHSITTGGGPRTGTQGTLDAQMRALPPAPSQIDIIQLPSESDAAPAAAKKASGRKAPAQLSLAEEMRRAGNNIDPATVRLRHSVVVLFLAAFTTAAWLFVRSAGKPTSTN